MTKTLDKLVSDIATGIVPERVFVFINKGKELVTTNVDNKKSIICLRSRKEAIRLRENNPGLDGCDIHEIGTTEVAGYAEENNCTFTIGAP